MDDARSTAAGVDRFRSRRWRLVPLLAVLIGGLVLPGGARGAPRTLTPVIVDTNPVLIGSAPILLAIEDGHFAEQGIEARIVDLRGPAGAFSGLLTGRTDVLGANLFAGLVEAVLQGGRLRIVADRGHVEAGERGSPVLMVRQDLVEGGRFRTLKDLRGMRIGLSTRGGIAELFLLRILRSRAFLTEGDVQVQIIPSALLPDAFAAKSLDAGIVAEPFITRLEALRLGKVVVNLPEILPNAQVNVVMYGPNLLGRYPGLAQRFMNGYLRGVQQYNQGKTARNVAILRKYTGQEEAILRETPWTRIHPDGRVNVKSIMQLQAWWLREGWIARTVPAEQLIDMRFARQAYRQLTAAR